MATGWWRTWLAGALAAGLCGTINHGCGGGDDEGNSKTSSACTGASCTPSVTGPMMPVGQNAGIAGANASPGSTGDPNAPAQGTAGSAPSTAGSTAPPAMMMPPGTVMGGSAGMDPPAMMDPMNPVEMVPSMPSSGCSAAEHPESGPFMIDVDGTQRKYIVKIPTDYDTNKPYKLVFAWHGLGGTAEQIAMGFRGGFYGLETRAMGSTIFVAGQGLETSNSVGSGPGWPNTGGQDVAFTKAMVAWLKSKYCIDEQRIFSVGMSYGGIMSNTVGCQMGDVFRAIAPMAGSGPGFGGRANCVGQVAVWMSHGDNDTVVSTMSGEASHQFWRNANHCEEATDPVGPDVCVAHQGCDDGFPMHWCLFPGGHTVPTFASEAIWAFFSQF